MTKTGPGREWIIVVMAAAVLAFDQLTKAMVMRNLMPGVPWNPIAFLRPIVVLNYVTNEGVAFGLFPQLSSYYVFIQLAVVGALILFYRRFAVNHWLMPVCLGLQLGGALGNLVDRLHFGHVIDFIDFKVWPVFNVADSCIVVGVLILAFLLLRDRPETDATQVGPHGR